jgi:hypothetical protein
MPLVLATSQYPDVRRAVNPTLDDVAIPDSIIASEVYSGRAARYVEAAVTNAAGRTGAEATAVQRAIMYKTAANIAEMMPEIKQSKLPDQEAIFDTYTRTERARLLNQIVEQEIATLNSARRTLVRPTFFTLATGSRY